MRLSFLLLLSSLLFMLSAAPAHAEQEPAAPSAPKAAAPAKTAAGLVSGLERPGGVRVYLGVPFAAPPVGERRWKPPEPAAPWEGVKACTEHGPWCPQPKPMMGKIEGKVSEDCLYLNLWTPAKGPEDRLPVMVWIHGGGYTTGSGSSAIYNGESLARRGLVLVSINYRLGPFGFLAHPLLSKESEKNVSGNYGFLDQIAALQWVRANVAAFGGDPGRVTIFGESAGAGSVCRLMVSPLAKGLFHRAIAQSGGALGRNRHLRETWYGVEPMEKLGEAVAAELGCDEAPDPLAALRAKSPDEILEASDASQGLFGKGNKFWPVVDGWALPDDPAAMMAEGKAAEVPFLTGFNANEGTVFLQQLPVRRPAGYRLAVRALFGDDAEEVLKLFPASGAEEVPVALDRLVTVSAFGASARWMARVLSRPKAPTWLYHFTRVPPRSTLRGFGAFHAAEIPYVFGTATAVLGWEDGDRALSETMLACWARFAANGDPNGEGVPAWAAYSAEKDEAMVFGDAVEARSGLFKESMDLFERVQTAYRDKRKDPSAFKKPGR